MKTSTKLVIAAALLGGVATYAFYRGAKSDRELHAAYEDALKQKSAAIGRIEGVAKAETARADELAAQVPALQAQLDAAQKAGAIVVAAQHWEGSGGAVAVPCPVVAASPVDAVPPTASNAPGTPSTASVTPHVRIDDAVLIDDGGGIYVARKVAARLTFGTGGSEWEPIEPDGAHAATVAPELAKAWADWRAPRRLPWQLDLFAAFGGPDPTAAAGGAFYPRGSRLGGIFQVQQTRRDLTACLYQGEGCSTSAAASTEFLLGATWRLGPKR